MADNSIGNVQSFSDYLATPSSVPAVNSAKGFMRLAQALAQSLQLMKDQISVRTDDLSQLNAFTATLRKWRPVTSDDAAEAASGGSKGDLGANEEEAKKLLAQLKFWGVDIKDTDYVTQGTDKGYSVKQGTYDQWLTTLSTAGDTISADIKQLETTSQSRLDQWSKAMDWVTEFFKKVFDVEQNTAQKMVG